MELTPDAKLIVNAQRRWARSTGRAINERQSGLGSRDEALLVPLPAEVEAQFAAAPGGELRRIHSFRSSSALVVNTFLPWMTIPTPLAHVLGGAGEYQVLSFEVEFDTGVSSPYLDAVLTGGDYAVAVESKFVEPYDDHDRSTFGDKYFASEATWAPFPELERLATRFSKPRACFERLDAAQLLKHAMGLFREFGDEGFLLVYVWFDIGGDRALQHRRDIDEFVNMISGAFAFRPMTYQELFTQLSQVGEPIDGYRAYLAERYYPQTL